MKKDHAGFYRKLREILAESQILEEEPMSRHTTFRVGGPADYYLTPQKNQVRDIAELCKAERMPYTVVGNGSNLLVGDRGIRGVALAMGKAAGAVRITDDGMIFAGAGALLSQAAQAAYQAGFGGMEFAAGIPGSVGGAVVMNAGAYGGEIRDVIVSADVLTEAGELLTLTREELDLSYRHSCVSEKGYIVLEAAFGLAGHETPKEEIRAQMEEFKKRRQEKQPLEYPSAGSTFKRPEGHFAGKLVMDAGLAGFAVGGAQVSEKHCGFVINKGGATAADIRSLIMQVQEKVKAQSGVMLEPEVRFVGEF